MSRGARSHLPTIAICDHIYLPQPILFPRFPIPDSRFPILNSRILNSRIPDSL
ncbi:hypothetical protein [Moorena sp. SIO3I6]|uniref:hypothetical protein n=1 Tax=Moorena sp. SIO3I6 TaxID=2607831 RepID=UPI0025EF3494|nr:hypothetical protein [Moorena sp. SIO3I6]